MLTICIITPYCIGLYHGTVWQLLPFTPSEKLFEHANTVHFWLWIIFCDHSYLRLCNTTAVYCEWIWACKINIRVNCSTSQAWAGTKITCIAEHSRQWRNIPRRTHLISDIPDISSLSQTAQKVRPKKCKAHLPGPWLGHVCIHRSFWHTQMHTVRHNTSSCGQNITKSCTQCSWYTRWSTKHRLIHFPPRRPLPLWSPPDDIWQKHCLHGIKASKDPLNMALWLNTESKPLAHWMAPLVSPQTAHRRFTVFKSHLKKVHPFSHVPWLEWWVVHDNSQCFVCFVRSTEYKKWWLSPTPMWEKASSWLRTFTPHRKELMTVLSPSDKGEMVQASWW